MPNDKETTSNIKKNKELKEPLGKKFFQATEVEWLQCIRFWHISIKNSRILSMHEKDRSMRGYSGQKELEQVCIAPQTRYSRQWLQNGLS